MMAKAGKKTPQRKAKPAATPKAASSRARKSTAGAARAAAAKPAKTAGPRRAPAERKAGEKTAEKRKDSARRTARAARGAKAAAPQKMVISHHDEDAFQTGLRAYAKYRDLGISDASGGMVQAHVIRLVPPCDPEEVSKRHYHDVDFQMVFVLKGWIRSEFEGQGEVTMRQGTCWTQPPRIKHTVLDYSDDCELLEIILPAEFETVTLDEKPGGRTRWP
jgi:hypothetical protein